MLCVAAVVEKFRRHAERRIGRFVFLSPEALAETLQTMPDSLVANPVPGVIESAARAQANLPHRLPGAGGHLNADAGVVPKLCQCFRRLDLPTLANTATL